jgi:hypothetical protein
VVIKRAVKAGVVAFLALVAACGGKVVINEEELGQGGDGGGSASVSGSSGPSQVCPWPDPVGDVMFCGSAAAGGQCSTAYCDQNGNVYESDCSAMACQCKHNSVIKCTCALNELGNICDGTSQPCCSPIP